MEQHQHTPTGTVGAYWRMADGCLVAFGRVPDRAPGRFDRHATDPRAARRLVELERLMRPSFLPDPSTLSLSASFDALEGRRLTVRRIHRPRPAPCRWYAPLDPQSVCRADPGAVVRLGRAYALRGASYARPPAPTPATRAVAHDKPARAVVTPYGAPADRSTVERRLAGIIPMGDLD